MEDHKLNGVLHDLFQYGWIVVESEADKDQVTRAATLARMVCTAESMGLGLWRINATMERPSERAVSVAP